MKIYLGAVVWRDLTVQHSQCMMMLREELTRRGIAFKDGTVVGDALVSRARSIVASDFLRSDCDVLLTIDSDIWFRAQDAIKLCEEAMRYGVIAALYMTRALQTQPALMLPPNKSVLFAENSQPVEVPFASTGFMAVRRNVLAQLSESLDRCHQGWNDRGTDTSFWPFYMPYVIPWEGDGHMYLSEDWAFCQRAKDQGQKIWLDPSIRLGHMGTLMLTIEDLVREAKPEPKPLRMMRDESGLLTWEVLNPVGAASSGGKE